MATSRARLPLTILLVVLAATSGCLDLFGRAFKDHDVARTPIDADGWNREGLFTVQVRESVPVEVRIEATATTGERLVASGLSSATAPAVELAIPDGTWTLRYFLDGTRWETFEGVRFDSTPPTVAGLESVGTAAADGSYLLGASAVVEAGARVEVIDQRTTRQVGSALPLRLTGLADGIQAFDVVVLDAAGNQATASVQVRVGSAQLLPPGQHTLGIVARYAIEAELWDISDLDAWMTPAQARQGAGEQWLGEGLALRPNDPAVQAVTQSVVAGGDTAGEAAFALFQWMARELDYDTGRLDDDDLLEPAQTIDNGGGVCRDLAALYVSLLRGAGVPARLVTGYLGGEVNGFHAWVEFYGGAGHGPSPWVPVDVSAITGPYEPEMALQAFGIRHTNMLPLRVVTEAQEDEEWATALSVRASYPAGSEPSVELAKTLEDEYDPDLGVLCVDPDTLARREAATSTQCPASFPLYLPNFERSASRILDYGAQITATKGTTVTLTLSYPDDAAVAPGTVEQQTYGASFTVQAGGTKQASWSR